MSLRERLSSQFASQLNQGIKNPYGKGKLTSIGKIQCFLDGELVVKQNSGNDFSEPAGGKTRYFQNLGNSLRTFDVIILLTRGSSVQGEIVNNETLVAFRDKLMAELINVGTFEFTHPLYDKGGSILCAVDGEITLTNNSTWSSIVINFSAKELTRVDVVPTAPATAQTIEIKKKNLFATVLDKASATLNFANASVQEIQNYQQFLNKASNNFTSITNQIAQLNTSANNTFLPTQNLVNSIKTFKNTIPKLIQTPQDLVNSFQDVFENISKIFTPLFPSSVLNDNNIQSLNAFARDPNATSSDEQDRFNVILLGYKSQLLATSLTQAFDMSFETREEYEAYFRKIKQYSSEIFDYQTLVGFNEYGDAIYSNIKPLNTQEIVEAYREVYIEGIYALESLYGSLREVETYNIFHNKNLADVVYKKYGNFDNLEFILQQNNIGGFISINGNFIFPK